MLINFGTKIPSKKIPFEKTNKQDKTKLKTKGTLIPFKPGKIQIRWHLKNKWQKSFPLSITSKLMFNGSGSSYLRWALPEIGHTPPKDMGFPKDFPTFFNMGVPKKVNCSFSHKGKEDMQIPQNFDHICHKKWEFPSQLFKYYFSYKIIINPILYIYILVCFVFSFISLYSIQPWEFWNIKLQICLSSFFRGLHLISGIADHTSNSGKFELKFTSYSHFNLECI